jgi:hypothetical protein
VGSSAPSPASGQALSLGSSAKPSRRVHGERRPGQLRERPQLWVGQSAVWNSDTTSTSIGWVPRPRRAAAADTALVSSVVSRSAGRDGTPGCSAALSRPGRDAAGIWSTRRRGDRPAKAGQLPGRPALGACRCGTRSPPAGVLRRAGSGQRRTPGAGRHPSQPLPPFGAGGLLPGIYGWRGPVVWGSAASWRRIFRP